jgi:hypothetical protein
MFPHSYIYIIKQCKKSLQRSSAKMPKSIQLKY